LYQDKTHFSKRGLTANVPVHVTRICSLRRRRLKRVASRSTSYPMACIICTWRGLITCTPLHTYRVRLLVEFQRSACSCLLLPLCLLSFPYSTDYFDAQKPVDSNSPLPPDELPLPLHRPHLCACLLSSAHCEQWEPLPRSTSAHLDVDVWPGNYHGRSQYLDWQ